MRLMRTYIGIELVDQLNSHLKISTMYRLSDLNSFLDAIHIGVGLDVGFGGKFFSRIWVSFGDQVIHDEVVHIAVNKILCQSISLVVDTSSRFRIRNLEVGSDSKINIGSSRIFREIPILSKMHHTRAAERE